MQKRILASTALESPPDDTGWLELAQVAAVELTSEDPEHPIELALRSQGKGWRAAGPGAQVIRLHFETPQRLRRIQLVFIEHQTARTHEFALRWSAAGSGAFQEIVRQQYNFAPRGATRQVEDYAVDLEQVTTLELSIIPDVGGQDCRASLAAWRLA